MRFKVKVFLSLDYVQCDDPKQRQTTMNSHGEWIEIDVRESNMRHLLNCLEEGVEEIIDDFAIDTSNQ